MTPGIALPDPIPLPGPSWLLWALLMLTFVLHVVAMNAVLGGAVIGAVARFQSKGGRLTYHAALARLVARALPVVIAGAVTLGVAALLFLQVVYGRVFFASSIIMAWSWFAVVPLLIAAYYAAYASSLRDGNGPRWLPIVVAGSALVIAWIYTTNMSLMLRPAAVLDAYRGDARGLRLLFGDPSMLPRYLHIVTGAVGTAAVVVAVSGLLARRRDEAFGRWMIRYGALWFASVSVVNMVVGLWWLATLPQTTLLALLGQNTTATIVLLLGVAAGLCAIVCTMAAAQSSRPWIPLTAGAVSLLATLVLMVFTRDFLRQASLGAAGFEPATWTVSQWGPITIFGVLLVLAVVVVVWMARALAMGTGAPHEQGAGAPGRVPLSP